MKGGCPRSRIIITPINKVKFSYKENQMKKFTWLIRFALFAAMLSACAAPATAVPTQPPASTEEIAAPTAAVTVPPATGGAEKPFDGETVTIISHGPPQSPAIFEFQDQFYQETGIKVNVIELAPEAMYEKIVTELTSGSGAVDIVEIQPQWLPDVARFLEPIDPLIKENNLDFQMNDFFPAALNPYGTWDKTLYGIPWATDVHGLYYRKDIFEKPEIQQKYKETYNSDLKPPTTWDEYKQIAEFFTGWDWGLGDGVTRYGTAEHLARGRVYWWFLNRFGGFGGVYFDENMKPMVNSEAGIKSLQNMVDVVPFMPPAALSFGAPEARAAYLNGDTAMLINWVSSWTAAEEVKNGQMGFAPLPNKNSSYAGAWDLAVTKDSKHKGAAATFIWWYSKPDISLQIKMGPYGLAPTRPSQLDSQEFITNFPYGHGSDYLQSYEENVLQGYPDLLIPGAAEYMDSLDLNITVALAKEATVQEALDKTAAEWDGITDRLGRDQQTQFWLQQFETMKQLNIIK